MIDFIFGTRGLLELLWRRPAGNHRLGKDEGTHWDQIVLTDQDHQIFDGPLVCSVALYHGRKDLGSEPAKESALEHHRAVEMSIVDR